MAGKKKWDRPTATKLVELLEQLGSKTKVAERIGAPRSTVYGWFHDAEIELGRAIESPTVAGTPQVVENGDAIHSAVLKCLGSARKRLTVEEIADRTDRAPKHIRAALAQLGEQGYRVEVDESGAEIPQVILPTDQRVAASPELFDGETIRFGVVSDTHLCSKADHPEHLATAYEIMAREGVQQVYHVGDLVDGLGIYRGHVSEVKCHTLEDQVDYALEHYPQIDGIRTAIISGNHDLEGDIGKIGGDPVAQFCSQRDDFDYLGKYSAWVDLPNGGDIHMLHPKGGSSYATSYRLQKIVEGYEGGTKPNALLCGHYHRLGHFPVRGVQTMLAGTFQGSTTFSIRLALGEPGLGFHIVDARMADDGSLVRWRPEFFPFYSGRVA